MPQMVSVFSSTELLASVFDANEDVDFSSCFSKAAQVFGFGLFLIELEAKCVFRRS